jgi:DNA-binding transcriptional LysR family regulator
MDRQLESLLAKDLDAGIYIPMGPAAGQASEYLTLARDEMGLALSESNRLAEKSPVPVRDLRSEQLGLGRYRLPFLATRKH